MRETANLSENPDFRLKFGSLCASIPPLPITEKRNLALTTIIYAIVTRVTILREQIEQSFDTSEATGITDARDR